MTQEEQVLVIKGFISGLPLQDQIAIKKQAEAFRELLKEDLNKLAFALVGAEIAAGGTTE